MNIKHAHGNLRTAKVIKTSAYNAKMLGCQQPLLDQHTATGSSHIPSACFSPTEMTCAEMPAMVQALAKSYSTDVLSWWINYKWLSHSIGVPNIHLSSSWYGEHLFSGSWVKAKLNQFSLCIPLERNLFIHLVFCSPYLDHVLHIIWATCALWLVPGVSVTGSSPLLPISSISIPFCFLSAVEIHV